MFVGPTEHSDDNLAGAAEKQLHAGANLYFCLLCSHSIVLCPIADIFYLALE